MATELPSSRARSSGPKGPRSPRNLSSQAGDRTPVQRPLPPLPGQMPSRDAIPFPDRSPPGRPAQAAAGHEQEPSLFFAAVDGSPLLWSRSGLVQVQHETASAVYFGAIALGDVLMGAKQAWEVVRICKSPAYSRNLRPRWDVLLAPAA